MRLRDIGPIAHSSRVCAWLALCTLKLTPPIEIASTRARHLTVSVNHTMLCQTLRNPSRKTMALRDDADICFFVCLFVRLSVISAEQLSHMFLPPWETLSVKMYARKEGGNKRCFVRPSVCLSIRRVHSE